MNTFEFKLLNPEKKIEKSDIVEVVVPTVDGIVSFWANHVSYLAALKSGEIRVKDKTNHVESYAISNGFAEFTNNTLKLLVGSFENAKDIDLSKAKERKENIQLQLDKTKDKIQEANLLTAFEKEKARIMVAEKLDN